VKFSCAHDACAGRRNVEDDAGVFAVSELQRDITIQVRGRYRVGGVKHAALGGFDVQFGRIACIGTERRHPAVTGITQLGGHRCGWSRNVVGEPGEENISAVWKYVDKKPLAGSCRVVPGIVQAGVDKKIT
jgi:hypothetical protein